MNKEYVSVEKRVQAYQIGDQTEIVNCYNGTKVGVQGDYVVTDEAGRTFIMNQDRFELKYTVEVRHV